ncbi:MAG: T9SS type A sorting domain-containing protein [Bacteroidales bacterium]
MPNQDIQSGYASIATNGASYYCSWLDVRIDNITPNVFAKVIGNLNSDVEPISEAGIPASCQLMQNYPNPVKTNTTIQFVIPYTAQVKLKVFDICGNEVATLTDEKLQPGKYQFLFDGNDLVGGVYFYRMEAISISGNSSVYFTETGKFICRNEPLLLFYDKLPPTKLVILIT